MVFSDCSTRIMDVPSKLWVLCDGLIRSQNTHLNSDSGAPSYYYLTNDAIQIYSAFAAALGPSDIALSKPGYLDQSDPNNIFINLDVIATNDGPAPHPETYYLNSYTGGDCGGGLWNLELGTGTQAAYYRWTIVDPTQSVIPI